MKKSEFKKIVKELLDDESLNSQYPDYFDTDDYSDLDDIDAEWPEYDDDEEFEDDHEGSMAKSDLDSIAAMAAEINDMIDVEEELEGWVQAKITLAADYIEAVHRYLKHEY